MKRSKPISVVLILVIMIVSPVNIVHASQPTPVPIEFKPLSDSEYAYNVINELSGDKYQGRRSGTPGCDKACEFAASEFKKFGLRYMKGLNSYYQYYLYDMAYVIGIPVLNIGGKALKYMDDFRIAGYSASSGGELTFNRVIFVSYGYKEDYAGLDVSGQAVVILEADPSGRIHTSSTDRIAVAKEKGAKAVIFVAENDTKTYGYNFIYPQNTNQGLPIFYINPKSADKYWGMKLAYAKPQNIDSKHELKVEIGYSPNTAAKNVVGVVEGQDTSQYIIISAHIDGIGIVGGKVYPSANDNASGSSVVLALARYFSSLGEKPACTLVFALFANEEEQMEGSRYFVQYFPNKPSSIIADVNFDVCGAKGNPAVYVDESFKLLHRAVKRAINESYITTDLKNKRSDIESLSGGSDFSSFKAQKIPFIYMCSGGGGYNHQINDNIKNSIDRETLGNVVNLARLSIENLAWKYTDMAIKYNASNMKKVYMEAVKHDMWMYETKHCYVYFSAKALESAGNILSDLDNVYEEVAFWTNGKIPAEKTKVYFTENNNEMFTLIGRSDTVQTGGVSNWRVNGISCKLENKANDVTSTSFPHELNHVLTGMLQEKEYGENIIEPYQEIEGRLVFLCYSYPYKIGSDLKSIMGKKPAEINFNNYDSYKQQKFNMVTYLKQGGTLGEWYSLMGSLQQYIMVNYGKAKMREIYYKTVSNKDTLFADIVKAKTGIDMEKLKKDWLEWLLIPVKSGNGNTGGATVTANQSDVLSFKDNGLKYESISYNKEIKSTDFELYNVGAASKDGDFYLRIICKTKTQGDVCIFLQGDAPGLKEFYPDAAVSGENVIVAKLSKQRIKSFTAGLAINISGNYVFIDKNVISPWID